MDITLLKGKELIFMVNSISILTWYLTNFSSKIAYLKITKEQESTIRLVIINKKNEKRTYRIADFAVKLKESKKKDRYLDLARELKKLWNMKVMVIPIVITTYCSRQRVGTWTWRLGNKRTRGDHPNYSIAEIGQNTEKCPGDLRGLVVTQNPVKKVN